MWKGREEWEGGEVGGGIVRGILDDMWEGEEKEGGTGVGYRGVFEGDFFLEYI